MCGRSRNGVLPSAGSLPKWLPQAWQSGRNQAPGTPSGSPVWEAGTQVLEPSLLLPRCISDRLDRNRAVETQAGTPIGDAMLHSNTALPCPPHETVFMLY